MQWLLEGSSLQGLGLLEPGGKGDRPPVAHPLGNKVPLQLGRDLPLPPLSLASEGFRAATCPAAGPTLPDGESPGLLLDFLPRRARNRSLTDLASSRSARFFFLSSSEMLMSGSWSFTRSMTCPVGSVEREWAPSESHLS